MSATQNILKLFEQISAIPRASSHEQQISRWLLDWAAERRLSARMDPAGNVIIRVPASAGYENAPTIILQGHLDMVCEKTPDSPHDFSKDPIRCIFDGDWLHADRTTLGADDGIAVAIALALVDDPAVAHPPLELLFTVEEEVGLGGALNLEPEALQGRILVNLDSELEGVFIVGCAGGRSARIQLPLSFEPTGGEQVMCISVGGLSGGHSGVDIHKHRASANRVLARLFGEIQGKVPFHIADLQGGTAHNAIAREAQATIVLPAAHLSHLDDTVQAFLQTQRAEYATTDPSIAIELHPGQASRMLTESDTEKAINLLQALPHGVADMSTSIEGFVETSNNLALIKIQGEDLHLHSSQRSTVMSRLEEITRRVASIGHLAGADVLVSDGYPAWQPDMNSPLLARSRKMYEDLFGQLARVEMIHAGLECGIIGKIYGDMDMISLGATILDPHSPNERLNIPSLVKVWDFLVELLKSYRTE